MPAPHTLFPNRTRAAGRHSSDQHASTGTMPEQDQSPFQGATPFPRAAPIQSPAPRLLWPISDIPNVHNSLRTLNESPRPEVPFPLPSLCFTPPALFAINRIGPLPDPPANPFRVLSRRQLRRSGPPLRRHLSPAQRRHRRPHLPCGIRRRHPSRKTHCPAVLRSFHLRPELASSRARHAFRSRFPHQGHRHHDHGHDPL